MFFELASLEHALFLKPIFAFPNLGAPDHFANGLYAQEVARDQQVLRALGQLIQLVLGVDQSAHVQVEGHRVASVDVTLPKRQDQFEKLRTHLELKAHEIGHLL